MTNHDRLIELYNLWAKALFKYHEFALALSTTEAVLRKLKQECNDAEDRYLRFRESYVAGQSSVPILSTPGAELRRLKDECNDAEDSYVGFRASCVAGQTIGGFALEDEHAGTPVSKKRKKA